MVTTNLPARFGIWNATGSETQSFFRVHATLGRFCVSCQKRHPNTHRYEKPVARFVTHVIGCLPKRLHHSGRRRKNPGLRRCQPDPGFALAQSGHRRIVRKNGLLHAVVRDPRPLPRANRVSCVLERCLVLRYSRQFRI